MMNLTKKSISLLSLKFEFNAEPNKYILSTLCAEQIILSGQYFFQLESYSNLAKVSIDCCILKNHLFSIFLALFCVSLSYQNQF
jgi:hypothetical protein